MKAKKRPSGIVVILACDGSRIDETEVVDLDIHEDIQGRDVLVFECPKCKQQHESLRLGRPRW